MTDTPKISDAGKATLDFLEGAAFERGEDCTPENDHAARAARRIADGYIAQLEQDARRLDALEEMLNAETINAYDCIIESHDGPHSSFREAADSEIARLSPE